MEHTDDASACIAHVLNTVGEMLADRGYTTAVAEPPVELPAELAENMGTLQRRDDSRAIMAVIFGNGGVDTARNVVQYLNTINPEAEAGVEAEPGVVALPDTAVVRWSLIVICNVKFTPSAVTELTAAGVDMFKTNELAVNKRLNRMVPQKYRVLTDEEKAALLSTMKESKRLSAIRPDDFIQRWYNAPVGSIYELEIRNGQLPVRYKHRVVRDDLD